MINLVVACSDKKRWPPDPQLCVRTLPAGSIEVRARAWTTRLEALLEGTSGIPAHMLYAGVYWTAVSSVFDKEGIALKTWVCSAGYGLIPLDAVLRPYCATFTPGQLDSICGVVPDNRDGEAWWQAVNSWPGPVPGAPRYIRDIVIGSSGAATMVVAGSHYLRAIGADLREAAAAVRDHSQLVILSGGASSNSSVLRGLESHIMRADSRWVPLLRGTRVSLNGKLAAELLRRSDFQADQLHTARQSMEQEYDTMKVHVMPRGLSQTPEEIVSFIEAALRKHPGVGHTVLLRRLRAEGKAFEYKRFRNIYNEVRKQFYAPKD